MGSFLRKISRENEKQKLKDIKKIYGNEPKDKCPKCHKKSLFMTAKDNGIYCIRCDSKISIKQSNS